MQASRRFVRVCSAHASAILETVQKDVHLNQLPNDKAHPKSYAGVYDNKGPLV